MNLIARYAELLRKRPLVSNMITTGILFGTGDVIAQTFFTREDKYDTMRTLRNVVYGAFVFAPIGNKLYVTLNNRVFFPFKIQGVGVKTRKLLDTTSRVAVDQLCWSPIGIALYFSCMTLMEGKGIGEIRRRCREKYVETLITNWEVWPLFQLANFALVPVAFRLLCVNVVSIVWNSFLSYENWAAAVRVARTRAPDEDQTAR